MKKMSDFGTTARIAPVGIVIDACFLIHALCDGNRYEGRGNIIGEISSPQSTESSCLFR